MRLFVALDLPWSVREQLAALSGSGIPGARSASRAVVWKRSRRRWCSLLRRSLKWSSCFAVNGRSAFARLAIHDLPEDVER